MTTKTAEAEAPQPIPITPWNEWSDDEWAERGADVATLLTTPQGALLNYAKLKTERQRAQDVLAGLDRGIRTLESRHGFASTERKRGTLTLLSELEVTPPEPPHFDRIADRGATLLFGLGGTGKGTYVAWLIKRAIRELGWRILILDHERRDYEWKPRFEALGLTTDEMRRIAYYHPTGDAIWEQVDTVQSQLTETGFTPDLVVVDSITLACSQDDTSSGDSTIPVRYYAALDQLCGRHLSITHTGHQNQHRPFGSRRWLDDCRLAWSFEKKGDDALLTCRKSNLGNLAFGKQLVRVTSWTDTTFPLPTDLVEEPYQTKLVDLIADILDEPMDIDTILDQLNASLDEEQQLHTRDAVKKALTRGASVGTFSRHGSRQRPTYSLPPTTKNDRSITLPATCAGCNASIPADDDRQMHDLKPYHPECSPKEPLQ